ncbi:3D domain-containing protein [Neobacillus sp. Marseille-QA0830]
MLYKFKTFIAASILSVSVGANVQAAVLTVGTGGIGLTGVFSQESEQSAVKDFEKWNALSSGSDSANLLAAIGQVNQTATAISGSHSFWVKTSKLKSAAPVITTDDLADNNVRQSGIPQPATVPSNQMATAKPETGQVKVPENVSENATVQGSEENQQTSEQPENVENNTSSNAAVSAETEEPKLDKPVPVDNKIEEGTSSNPAENATPATKELTVTATAYTASCEGCSGITKTGVDIKSNPEKKVIAVDPEVIPLGSKVYVEGYGEAIAADTGGAIKGHRIDVFIPTEQGALNWGRKEVKLQIIN